MRLTRLAHYLSLVRIRQRGPLIAFGLGWIWLWPGLAAHLTLSKAWRGWCIMERSIRSSLCTRRMAIFSPSMYYTTGHQKCGFLWRRRISSVCEIWYGKPVEVLYLNIEHLYYKTRIYVFVMYVMCLLKVDDTPRTWNVPHFCGISSSCARRSGWSSIMLKYTRWYNNPTSTSLSNPECSTGATTLGRTRQRRSTSLSPAISTRLPTAPATLFLCASQVSARESASVRLVRKQAWRRSTWEICHTSLTISVLHEPQRIAPTTPESANPLRIKRDSKRNKRLTVRAEVWRPLHLAMTARPRCSQHSTDHIPR